MSSWRKVWLQLDLLWKSSRSAHYSTSLVGEEADSGNSEREREREVGRDGERE